MVSWWNMDKNGGYDIMTKHGGCPVVIGSKWITNKWEAFLSVFKGEVRLFVGSKFLSALN